MNFSTDRDLLAIDPTVFDDVPVLAQQRLKKNDAQLSDTTLTSASANFVKAQVEPGSVVTVNQRPFEVIERIDGSTLTVSLPRTRLDDEPIPAPESEGFDLTIRIRTFAPQAAVVHDALLRMLGLEPDNDGIEALDPLEAARLSEDAVISLTTMATLEALGTLELVYAGGAALTSANEMLWHKTQYYRRRFSQAKASTRVMIDTNDDGRADERRRLSALTLTRV